EMMPREKGRDRPYETREARARDLRRSLDDEPVEASPPSATYRLRKLARRYRTALRVVGAFVALSIVAAVVSTRQAYRATRAERAARFAEAETRAERDRARTAERSAPAEADK